MYGVYRSGAHFDVVAVFVVILGRIAARRRRRRQRRRTRAAGGRNAGRERVQRQGSVRGVAGLALAEPQVCPSRGLRHGLLRSTQHPSGVFACTTMCFFAVGVAWWTPSLDSDGALQGAKQPNQCDACGLVVRFMEHHGTHQGEWVLRVWYKGLADGARSFD